MENETINNKLKQLKIEDFIWLIYIGIIFLSWHSNNLERKYFVHNDLKSKKKYREIMILIFSILIVVYFYFLNDSYKDLKNINYITSKKKKDLIIASFISSLLIFISGIIFLGIAIVDEDLDVEIAFN